MYLDPFLHENHHREVTVNSGPFSFCVFERECPGTDVMAQYKLLQLKHKDLGSMPRMHAKHGTW